jgi:glycosyltransferase involved in cell wall biosynthesis
VIQPRVSVVIPTYNRAADLRRALASVAAQTFADWEAVVVDNHSIDDTAQVVASFADPRIRLLMIHNGGIIARSRNLGIKEARGEFIALLDSDDWWQPRKLELSVRALERGADVVYHDLYLVKSGTRHVPWVRARTRALGEPAFDDLIQGGPALNTSSAVMRREALGRVDGISEDPDLVAWEDYDWWLRLARAGARFERLPQTLGFYWYGGGNASSPDRVITYLAHIRYRYLDPLGLGDDGRRPAWYEYGMGRACFHKGRYADARQHLRLAIGGRMPILKQAKALVTIAQAAFR